jgi:hypothetical protein
MKDLGLKRKDYGLVEEVSKDKSEKDYPTLYLRDAQVESVGLPSDAFDGEGSGKFKAEVTFEVTSVTKSKNKDGSTASVDLKILSMGDVEPYESDTEDESEEDETEVEGEEDNEEMDDTTEKENEKLRPVDMGLLD